jgi:hypothetical protein
MQRHELDPLSLVAGVVFVVVGGGYAIGGLDLHWIAVLPATLIILGVLVLAAVARRSRPVAGGETPPDV